MDIILEAKNISKTYAGIRVLDSVDFNLRRGEVHALVGENGAGKTTLIKILAGVVSPDEGSEIFFDGERIHRMTTIKSRQLGISVIYQDISLFPNLTVAENICIGNKRHGLQNWKEIYKQSAEILDKMGIDLDLDVLLEETSIGQQQLVAIARAITFNAKVIVMDEPTASLSASEIEMLFSIVRKLKEQGIGIIYISHKFEEIFALADRVSVLRDGSLVACDTIDKFDEHSLIRLMVGRELRFIPYHNQSGIGEVLFEVKNLTCEPYFRNVSFQVYRNEILGITGLVGAGRSELAQCIFGLHKHHGGEIYLNGVKVEINNVAQAIEKGICYLPEDRREQGLFMTKSMRWNISSAKLRLIMGRLGLLSNKKETDLARDYIKQLDIRPPLPDINVINLSGGNQQKTLVARWLSANPKLLIVDEITSGVDVGVKTEIHKLLRELASSGVAVVMISSDLPEVLALSDRIMIMKKGNVVGFMDIADATQENVLEKGILG